MVVFSGIQQILSHVRQMYSAFQSWFAAIDWTLITDVMPIPIAGMFVIVLALSGIGLIKKFTILG